jgi:FtsH-binding integral membrane protein
MSRGTKGKSKRTGAQRAAQAAREAKVLRVQLALGYGIVAVSVVAGFVMSFWPQVFGMQTRNPAIGFGLAALALFRLYALRKEVRRQSAEAAETDSTPRSSQHPMQASAYRALSGRTLP